MTGPDFILQVMEQSGMLLAMADDDPHYFVLATDPRREKLSTIEVSEDLFQQLRDAGRIRPVDMGDGTAWWERVP